MIKFLLLALLIFSPDLKAETEFECLVKNVYYEARGEPFKGQLAVALVTLNRVNSRLYPNTICEVVYQKYQFSWTALNKLPKIVDKAWNSSWLAAYSAYMNRNSLGIFLATNFHSVSIDPQWKLKRITIIGNHAFYGSTHAR